MKKGLICPYCSVHTYRSSDAQRTITTGIFQGEDVIGLIYYSFVCPNCESLTVDIELCGGRAVQGEPYADPSDIRGTFRAIPQKSNNQHPIPEYVPIQIRGDFVEACAILELSPKASATLSRRCLQGMIYDFWNIRERRLVDDISALEGKVSQSTWEAIDALRKVGNVGAHMEHDVNLIIDVEQAEAQALIELIESLISDWYVRRHEDEKRLERIRGAADRITAIKQAAKGGVKSPT
ncbi:DUF4145 domain-containing protein [Xanthomonas campestris pv. raphani]|uniref:DUF4145 domain-containing protein n=1 Tax=Xanthomonas campestris TaxID=339 RepID=UPI002B22D1C7|nr:DUF4145 domain-containing protein [Xanthomonas campestris]MEA9759760.1 DUF4145 domain-containing protein [Xanthomonas campestris pv. raphani]